MMANIKWLDWPAPDNVKACYTLRTGGYSRAPYDSLNLSLHVGDCPRNVHKNRRYLNNLTNGLVDTDAICRWVALTSGVISLMVSTSDVEWGRINSTP